MKGEILWIVFILYLISPASLMVSFPIRIETFPSNNNNYLKFKYQNLKFPSDISGTPKNLIAMNITLGTPPQDFIVIIDTGSLLLYVMEEGSTFESVHKFKPGKSKTFQNLKQYVQMSYVTGKTAGYLGRDKIGVNKEEMGDISFLVAKESSFNEKNIDGIFGLGRKYNGNTMIPLFTDDFSFLIQMLKSHKIDKNLFSIDLLSQKIYFGEKHADFEKENVSNCALRNKDKPFWTCRLSYVTFGENVESNFKKRAKKFYIEVVIDSGSNVSLFQTKYLEVFLEIFGKEECRGLIDGIVCKSIDHIKDIYFVFNGKALRMKKENIFMYNEEYGYIALILFANTNLNLLGLNFLKDYHTLFDNENEQIMFYSDDSNKIYDVSKYTTDKDFVFSDHLIGFLIGGILVVICGIIIGVAIYVCKKRQLENGMLLDNKTDLRIVPAQEGLII